VNKSKDILRPEPSAQEQHSVDYRTALVDAARLPGESVVDKHIRIAAKLRISAGATGESLDLPDPTFPKKICRLSAEEFNLYDNVIIQLRWLELAAIKTSRKSPQIAIRRFYIALEKECGVAEGVITSYQLGLTTESKRHLRAIAECVLRSPKHNPFHPPKYKKSRTHANVLILRPMHAQGKSESKGPTDQATFEF